MADRKEKEIFTKITKRVWSPTLKAFVDTKKVIERYGVHPNNFCLAKSIVGDKSDNIPGVNRVGFKSLVKKYPVFSNSEELFIQDVLDMSKKIINEGNSTKIVNEIYNAKILIKRNYKLVNLDVQNLSQFQIKKINDNLENLNLTWKNIEAHRLLNKLSIKLIDIIECNQLFKQIKSRNTT